MILQLGFLALLGAAPVGSPLQTPVGSPWVAEDWRIFSSKVRWGAAERLDTMEVGRAVARLARTFVGATYTPGTLEVPGPEHVVINLRELDCVTFVENVIALVRFIRRDGVGALADTSRAQSIYRGYLQELRYRGGALAGYASRLHYFSEWLADNERRGLLKQVSKQLGGVRDREPIDFMTAHAAAYRQLADSSVRADIAAVEARLNRGGGRWYLPKSRIKPVAKRIRDGDLIAATSARAGLDVAHTGFAIWVGGALHLVHAPLVGKTVEISELPLADRIQKISSQDGIMVARLGGAAWRK